MSCMSFTHMICISPFVFVLFDSCYLMSSLLFSRMISFLLSFNLFRLFLFRSFKHLRIQNISNSSVQDHPLKALVWAICMFFAVIVQGCVSMILLILLL